MLREKIIDAFGDVYRSTRGAEPPELSDDTVLLETGLDSLGFAILVVKLEQELGYDPFTSSAEAFYPETLGQFVEYYEQNQPS